MKIDTVVAGDFQTNCFVVRGQAKSHQCVVIDVGLEASALVTLLQQQSLEVVAVLLTHGHADHIGGLPAIRKVSPDLKLYVHRLDARMLEDAQANLSFMTGGFITVGPPDIQVEDGDWIEEAGLRLQVLHTPGHTPGGICLYDPEEAVLFSDDVLFADSIGRTDFPGGNTEQLLAVIRNRIAVLPDETKVYPGHGPQTTIGQEKQTNPFLS